MLRRLKARRLTRYVRRRGGRPAKGTIRYDDVTDALRKAGVVVQPYSIKTDDLGRFIAEARYADRPYYRNGQVAGAREKYLEHYVSVDLLAPKSGEVLIDVACMESPFWEVAAELYDVKAYRQDLIFPPGLQGHSIGGNAAAMPVPDGFADLLTLHCSFEHFEGDSDSGFIREASRVLRPGGRACILPLYTSSHYAIQTHVRGWGFKPTFEFGDAVYIAEHWGPPYARFYDATSFVRRVVGHLDDLRLTVLAVENTSECGDECYLRFAAVLEKP